MAKAHAQSTATEELIERLSRTQARTPTIVSCYVRLSPAARTKQAYLVRVMNQVRELEPGLAARGLDPADQALVRADIKRIVRWLANSTNLPPLPGIALFASSKLGVFEKVPLARVHRDRVDIDTRPLLHELLDAQETLGHYLAVAIDRTRARFFHVTSTGGQELTALVPSARRGGKFTGDRKDAPGWSEFRYHQKIASELNRHYAQTAREIGRLLQARPYQGVALLGPKAHTTALSSFLSPRQIGLLLGSARLNPTALSAAEASLATWRLQWDAERAGEARLLDRLEEAIPTGWAVNGIGPTLRALANGRVRELIVADKATGSGFRCGTDGPLVLSAKECRGAGSPTPVPNLIDHAIEDALRQKAQVTVIDDPGVADRVDGLAATFRFRTRSRPR